MITLERPGMVGPASAITCHFPSVPKPGLAWRFRDSYLRRWPLPCDANPTDNRYLRRRSAIWHVNCVCLTGHSVNGYRGHPIQSLERHSLQCPSLSSRPTFAIVVVLTLALGIGVNVAIFSLFQQILLRPPLPVAEPERLVNLTDPGPKLLRELMPPSVAGGPDSVFSYPMFRDLEHSQEPFVGIAAHGIFDASLSTGEEARRDTGIFVSGSYFSLLGLQPTVGRLLGPQDNRVDGQAESVVLSHAYWQREFRGDSQVVGRRLTVNGTPLTIVGVAPPGFHGMKSNEPVDLGSLRFDSGG